MLLCLDGELDMATAPALRERLRLLRDSGEDVQLDLSEVSFIDSSGAHVLLSAKDAAASAGRPLKISSPSPPVRRVLSLLGLDRRLLA